jgi:hypothetical protein
MIQYYGVLWIYASYTQKHDKRMTNGILYITGTRARYINDGRNINKIKLSKKYDKILLVLFEKKPYLYYFFFLCDCPQYWTIIKKIRVFSRTFFYIFLRPIKKRPVTKALLVLQIFQSNLFPSQMIFVCIQSIYKSIVQTKLC